MCTYFFLARWSISYLIFIDLLVMLKNKYYQPPSTLIFRLGMNKQLFPQPELSILFCRSHSRDKIFQPKQWNWTWRVEWGEKISAHSPPCPRPSSTAGDIRLGSVIAGHSPHGSQQQQMQRRSYRGKVLWWKTRVVGFSALYYHLWIDNHAIFVHISE